MSCMVHCVDRIEREVLELVCRMCVCVSVYVLDVCVLELAGPVSVHALEPVSYSAALSSFFSLKLPDSTVNTTHTHTVTHKYTYMNTQVSQDMTSSSHLDAFRVQM